MSTKANIILEAGTDFNVPIELLDVNGEELVVDTLTAAAQMRTYYNSSHAIDFQTTIANGSLILTMSAVATANIAPGRYVYDVNLIDSSSNVVSRLVEGIVTVTPGVTR